MVIFPLAPDQTIAQMWSNGARGGSRRTEWAKLNDATLYLNGTEQRYF